MTDTKRKIVRNSIANYLFRGFQIAIGLYLFPFILHRVGAVMFGIWLLVQSITGKFGLLDVGLSRSIMKHVSEYIAKGKKEKVNEVINTAFLFFLIMGSIAAAALFIFGHSFLGYFEIQNYEVARSITYLLAISILFRLPYHTFPSILKGLQRYDVLAEVNFVGSIVRLLTVIIVLSKWGLNGGIIDLVFWLLVTEQITYILYIVAIKKLLPYLKLTFSFYTKRTRNEIVKFSSGIFVVSISGTIIYNTDKIVLGAFIGSASVAFYEVSNKFHKLVRQAFSMADTSLMPATSELEAKKQHEKLKKMVTRGTKYLSGIVLSVTIPGIILAEPLIRYWVGSEYLFMTIPTQIFIVYWIFTVVRGPTQSMLQGMGRLKVLIYFAVGTALLNLILSLILVNYFGVLGVILGTSIAAIATMPIKLKVALDIIGVKFKTLVKESISKTHTLMPLPILVLIFLLYIRYPTNLIETGIYGLIGFFTYLIPFYIFSLDKNEKDFFKSYLLPKKVL